MKNLTTKILIALVLGAVTGVTINLLAPPPPPDFEAREVIFEELELDERRVTLEIPAGVLEEPADAADANRAAEPTVSQETLRIELPAERVEKRVVETQKYEQPNAWLQSWLTHGLFDVIGRIFKSALMLLVVPLVFVSLVCGVAALDDVRKLGGVGIKTIAFYLATTAIAITLAMSAAILVRPGEGFNLVTDKNFEGTDAPPLTDVIVNIFPTNPVEAMAEGNMLQIIVFAILFGMAMTLSGEAGQRILRAFQDLNAIIMKLVMILMTLAPYGVFALIAQAFAEQGFSAFQNLLFYFFTVLGVLLIHALVTYPALLKLLSGLNPLHFLGKMRKAQLFAFSTASSNATIPITMEVTERELGVKKSIGSFTVPLGATINMDGTAIMQGVATIFIAQAYGLAADLTLLSYLTVIGTATLASIGTAGVPGVGTIMLAMVLQQVGLPVDGIAIILAVDRLLDMVRTAVNITGDATVSCIVAKSEGQLDEDAFAKRAE